jgi:RNA polymerase sigma-70 factor (ECF subfamily)
MEQALEKYGSRNADGSLYSWLCAILYRQFLDGKRASARINRWLDVMRGVDAPSAPSAQDAWEQRAALDRLSLLPADQRAVLLLVSVEGMSYRDIATTLDLPLGTVMSRLSRARQAFRAVTDYDEQPSMLRIVR